MNSYSCRVSGSLFHSITPNPYPPTIPPTIPQTLQPAHNFSLSIFTIFQRVKNFL